MGMFNPFDYYFVYTANELADGLIYHVKRGSDGLTKATFSTESDAMEYIAKLRE